MGESVEAVGEVPSVVGGEKVGCESLCLGHRRLGRHHAVHHEACDLCLGMEE